MSDFSGDFNNDEFAKWFWFEKNGNNLINDLNGSPHNTNHHTIRREELTLHVYGIVVNNHPKFYIENGENNWKLMKIGRTKISTKPKNNRMENVKRETALSLSKAYPDSYSNVTPPDVSIIFVYHKPAINTESDNTFENRIRLNWGVPLESDCAKVLKLPYCTEWIMTTQTFIKKYDSKKGINSYIMPKEIRDKKPLITPVDNINLSYRS